MRWQTEIVFFFQTHFLHSGFAKMDIADCAQTLCCLFCGQVSLGFCQHFITNHKFTYGGGAQQRRIKVRVQLPVLILFAIKWRAVPAHRVGEGALEEVVITTGQLFNASARSLRWASVKSVIRKTWALGSSSVSNGQAAQ